MKKFIATLLLLTFILVACAAPADPLEPAFEPVEENLDAPPPTEPEAVVEAEEPPQDEETPAEVPAEPVEEEAPQDASTAAFAWPVLPPTADQIAEAQVCDLANLPRNRYAGDFTLDQLRGVYEPVIACDWVVLALAYVERLEEDQAPPQEAIDAYLEGIRMNPALALRTQVFYAYFGVATNFVEVPPAFAQNIVAVDLRYEWNGLGNPVSYQITIMNANTSPVVSGEVVTGGESLLQPGEGQDSDPTPEPPVLPATVDQALVQAMAPALGDFWPVTQQVNIFPCTDNYPNWFLTLTFEDGTVLDLITDGSNFLTAGGPWQAIINDQPYLQLSPNLADAVTELLDGLGLPLGQPLRMSCLPDQSIFDYAYDIEE